jgi:putative lipoprotein
MRALVLAAAALLAACATPTAAPQALDGTSWTMLGVEGPTPTIVFGEGGAASGSTGCNRWSGRVDRSNGGSRIQMMGVTEMACPGPAMNTEARFFALLEQSRSFEVYPLENGALIFFGGEAEELARFAPTP